MLVPRWYQLVNHDNQPVSHQRREDKEARKKFPRFQYEQVWAFPSFDFDVKVPINDQLCQLPCPVLNGSVDH
jgi:hypothetical protein